jgi:hypothetical protein
MNNYPVGYTFDDPLARREYDDLRTGLEGDGYVLSGTEKNLLVGLKHVQRVVQTKYDLMAGKVDPEEVSMLSERIINIGQFLANNQDPEGGSITEAQAQKFYKDLLDRDDQASKDLMNLAVRSITIDRLGLVDDPDLTLTPDQQDTIDKYFFGSKKKDSKVGETREPKVFTLDNARTLVNEIAGDMMADSDIIDQAAIWNMQVGIANTLYSDWEVTPEGGLRQSAELNVRGLGSPFFEYKLRDLLKFQSNELKFNPEFLLKAWKVEEVLELMVTAGIISRNQKTDIKFPELYYKDRGEIPHLAEDEMGAPFTRVEDTRVTAVRAMMGNVVQFVENNPNSADWPKDIEADKELPFEEQKLPPLGMDLVTQRQIEYDENLLDAYGQEGKPFKDRVTALMKQLGIETDASLVVGKTQKDATNLANARFRDYVNEVAKKARAGGVGELEVFRAVNDAAITYMEQESYQQVFTEHVEFITQNNLSTTSGRKKFLDEYYSETRDLNTEQFNKISDALIGASSRGEANRIISEMWDDAIKASYQLDNAKEDFNAWYESKGLKLNDLDSGEHDDWIERVRLAGGIQGLLAQQEWALISDAPRTFPVEDITFSEDEIAAALLNNIASRNAAALDEPPEGIEAFNKFLGDEFFAATRQDLSNFPDVKRRLRSEMFGMGRNEASVWLSDNVQRIYDEVTAEVTAAAIIPGNLTAAISQIQQMYVDEKYDIGEIPASIINSAAAKLFRSSEGLTEELRQQFIADLKTQLPALEEQKAFAKTQTLAGLKELAFDIAVDEGIISPSTSSEFIQHFEFNTIPRVIEAASMGDFETTGEYTDFFLNEFRLGTEAGVSFVSPTIDPADLALMEPGGYIPPDTVAVPVPAEEAVSGLKSFDVSEADYTTQLDPSQIPMFPTEFEWEGKTYPIGKVGDIPSPKEVKKSSDDALKRRRDEEGDLDFGRAVVSKWLSQSLQERVADDSFPTAKELEQAGRDRRREAEDLEYDQEQRRLRRMPQAVSATEFATAIREAAPDDIGFQEFLLGDSAKIRGGFPGTVGTPLDFSEYFVGITSDKKRRFGETPEGVASELMRFEREELEVRGLERETELDDAKAERERRESLRGRGRTKLRI